MNIFDKIIIIVTIVFVSIMLLYFNSVFADYQEPTSKTQINKQTDLFNRSFDNYEDSTKQFESIKEAGVDSLKNKSGLEFITDKSESELTKETKELSDIPARELNNRGNREMIKERMIDKLYVDYTRPLNKQVKVDVKKIAKGQDALLANLIGKLKELGVDCKTVKGDKIIEPELYLQIENEPIKNTKYNQTFCEELMGEYLCSDELSLHCSDVSYVAGTLTNMQGNMTHTITQDGILTIGVNKTKYFYQERGAQQDYEFTFDIAKVESIESFKLMDVAWSDYVLIELNGKMIFGSDGVKGKLEMSTDPANYRACPANTGQICYGVDRGDGMYVPTNTKRYFDASPNFEAKSYLKNGQNTLHIRLVYCYGGKIWTRVKYQEKTCKFWQETWKEECKLK